MAHWARLGDRARDPDMADQELGARTLWEHALATTSRNFWHGHRLYARRRFCRTRNALTGAASIAEIRHSKPGEPLHDPEWPDHEEKARRYLDGLRKIFPHRAAREDAAGLTAEYPEDFSAEARMAAIGAVSFAQREPLGRLP